MRCPILWKPGLQEQKESVPLVTQCASSPSPHWVRLLLQSFSLVSGHRGEAVAGGEWTGRSSRGVKTYDRLVSAKVPVLHLSSSEPKSSQSLKKLQRSVELMHLWLAHWNSSFSHVGTAGAVAGGGQGGKGAGEPLPSSTRNERKKAKLTAVDFIRAVSAVVDAVASPGQRQAHAVVLAAEGSGRGALEPP